MAPHRALLRLLFLVALTAAFAACSTDDSSSPLPRAPGGSADELAAKQAAKDAAADAAARSAADTAEKERAVLGKAALRRVLDTGKLALEKLDTAATEIERWNRDVEPLLTNDQGRAIAAEDRFLDSFAEVYRKERPSKREVDAVRAHLEELLTLPRDAEKTGSSYAPSETLQGEVDKDRQWADAAVHSYQGAREQIAALLAGAQKTNAAPAPQTLQAALDDLAARRALASADADRARGEKLRAEQAASKADAEEKLAALQRAEAEKNAAAERDRIAQEAELERQTKGRDAEQERLKKLADDPHVRSQFAPILSKGLYVPCLTPRRVYDYPKPMSYSQMQSCGGTTNVKAFIQLGLGGWNDRPAWKAPRTEEEWKHYEELLELFNQLAPIWIEGGVLQK